MAPDSDRHGDLEIGAWLTLLFAPITSVLGICLCLPLIAAANRLDGTAHHQADRAVGPYDLLLPLAALIAIVSAYSFIAAPPMSSVMTGKPLLANVLAMPDSFLDGAPVYICGALIGAATYTLAARWMARTHVSYGIREIGSV